MPDNLDQQLRKLKDEVLLQKERDEALDSKIAALEWALKKKHEQTKHDKWNRHLQEQ